MKSKVYPPSSSYAPSSFVPTFSLTKCPSWVCHSLTGSRWLGADGTLVRYSSSFHTFIVHTQRVILVVTIQVGIWFWNSPSIVWVTVVLEKGFKNVILFQHLPENFHHRKTVILRLFILHQDFFLMLILKLKFSFWGPILNSQLAELFLQC